MNSMAAGVPLISIISISSIRSSRSIISIGIFSIISSIGSISSISSISSIISISSISSISRGRLPITHRGCLDIFYYTQGVFRANIFKKTRGFCKVAKLAPQGV